MSDVVTVIGESGYVGQLLRGGLTARGFDVDVFDPFKGPVVNALRRRYFARAPATGAARLLRAAQRRAEPALVRAGVIRRGEDDMLGASDLLRRRFSSSTAVIHLAGIPHPHWPGASTDDFVRLNYDAAVNVFAAAREAGVRTFVHASSARIYRINDPVRLDHLPILETNYLPLPSEGQSAYGFLKAAYERYLDGACSTGSTQALALRLECPGFLTMGAANLFISTSVENLIDGFACALKPPSDIRFEAFNLADADVDPGRADIGRYVRTRWPYVPSEISGNPCLLSTEKAQRILGYRPIAGGRYIDSRLVW